MSTSTPKALDVAATDIDFVRVTALALQHGTLDAEHGGVSAAMGPARAALSATRRAVVEFETETRDRERTDAIDRRLAGLVAERDAAAARHDALRESLDRATARLHASRVLLEQLRDELGRRGLERGAVLAALGGRIDVLDPPGGAAELERITTRERAMMGAAA